MQLGAGALMFALKLSAPFLIAGLVVGVMVSVVQAATQIQEMTLQLIPKIIVFLIVLVVAGPWMMSEAISYTRDLWQSIPDIVR